MNYILEEFQPRPVSNCTNVLNNNIRFIATLQEANKPNRNGRIYTKEAIDAALKHPLIQEKLRTRSWLMEVGHPAIQDLSRQRTVQLDNFCALIEDYWWEGNTLKAHCLTLNNTAGAFLKSLIEVGGYPSFSMRGTGKVTKDPTTGLSVVGEGLQITTYDWVYVPSHPEAYMDSLCESFNEFTATNAGMIMPKDVENIMFNVDVYGGDRQVALRESLNVYENGAVVELNEVSVEKTFDYTKNYYDKYKKLSETYQYDENDKITAISENLLSVTVHNDIEFATKQIMTEDFVVKNIRHKLTSIMNEAAEEAIDVNANKKDTVQKISPASELIKALKTASINFKTLHRNLVGGNWFEIHEILGDYYTKIDGFEDSIVENLIALGVKDVAVDAANITEPRPVSEKEALAFVKDTLINIKNLCSATRKEMDIPASVAPAFDELENWIHIEAEYKLAHYFGGEQVNEAANAEPSNEDTDIENKNTEDTSKLSDDKDDTKSDEDDETSDNESESDDAKDDDDSNENIDLDNISISEILNDYND